MMLVLSTLQSIMQTMPDAPQPQQVGSLQLSSVLDVLYGSPEAVVPIGVLCCVKSP